MDTDNTAAATAANSPEQSTAQQTEKLAHGKKPGDTPQPLSEIPFFAARIDLRNQVMSRGPATMDALLDALYPINPSRPRAAYQQRHEARRNLAGNVVLNSTKYGLNYAPVALDITTYVNSTPERTYPLEALEILAHEAARAHAQAEAVLLPAGELVAKPKKPSEPLEQIPFFAGREELRTRVIAALGENSVSLLVDRLSPIDPQDRTNSHNIRWEIRRDLKRNTVLQTFNRRLVFTLTAVGVAELASLPLPAAYPEEAQEIRDDEIARANAIAEVASQPTVKSEKPSLPLKEIAFFASRDELRSRVIAVLGKDSSVALLDALLPIDPENRGKSHNLRWEARSDLSANQVLTTKRGRMAFTPVAEGIATDVNATPEIIYPLEAMEILAKETARTRAEAEQSSRRVNEPVVKPEKASPPLEEIPFFAARDELRTRVIAVLSTDSEVALLDALYPIDTQDRTKSQRLRSAARKDLNTNKVVEISHNRLNYTPTAERIAAFVSLPLFQAYPEEAEQIAKRTLRRSQAKAAQRFQNATDLNREVKQRPLRNSPYANQHLNDLLVAYEGLQTPITTIGDAAHGLIALGHKDLAGMELLHFLAGRTPIVDPTCDDAIFYPLPSAMAEIAGKEPKIIYKDALAARGLVVTEDDRLQRLATSGKPDSATNKKPDTPPKPRPSNEAGHNNKSGSSVPMPTQGFAGLVAAAALNIHKREVYANATSITPIEIQQIILSRMTQNTQRHRNKVAARYAKILTGEASIVSDGELTRDARGITKILGIDPLIIDPQTGSVLSHRRAPTEAELRGNNRPSTPSGAPSTPPASGTSNTQPAELNTPNGTEVSEPDTPTKPEGQLPTSANTVLIDAIAAESEIFTELLKQNHIESDQELIVCVANANRISTNNAQIAVRQTASGDLLDRHGLKFKGAATLTARGLKRKPQQLFIEAAGQIAAKIDAKLNRQSDGEIVALFDQDATTEQIPEDIFNLLVLRRPEVGGPLAMNGVHTEDNFIERYMETVSASIESAIQAMIDVYNGDTTLDMSQPQQIQYINSISTVAAMADIDPDILCLTSIRNHFPHYVERLIVANIRTEAELADAMAAKSSTARSAAVMTIMQLKRGGILRENGDAPTFSGHAYTAAGVIDEKPNDAFPEVFEKSLHANNADAGHSQPARDLPLVRGTGPDVSL